MNSDMNFPFFDFINELDDEQKAAALVESDTVVSAAAGSGKTRVLTARYGALVMSGKCTVEEILTITFTNKAANEMYSRIYELLAKYAPHNTYAAVAIENFHKARICTLDSFSASVARSVCAHYGISPDFTTDDPKIKELARSLALRFVLDKREIPALQQFIAEKKMRGAADELFVNPMLKHSPISRPLDFTVFEKIQREEIQNQWKKYTEKTRAIINEIKLEQNNITDGESSLKKHLNRMLPKEVQIPDIEILFNGADNAEAEDTFIRAEGLLIKENIIRYLDFLSELISFKLNLDRNTETIKKIKDNIRELKDKQKGLYHYLEALANHALQWDFVKVVFSLMEEYQKLLNQNKREAGILTFTDIAHLAVDGLRSHPDIRKVYRDSFKMIMIDEFQDNNKLQRDLVELLSDPAKVFYVGDEKQSIYRFRGADVSVFRSLANQINGRLNLSTNYRSEPALNNAFNHIFDTIFSAENAEHKDFEAGYNPIQSGKESVVNDKLLHFAFFDKGRLTDTDFLRAEEYEAAYIARQITELLDKKTKIYDKHTKNLRDCTYGDIAILQRSYTHQQELEKYFKIFKIPFNADRPAGLFYDAPVNDLRLLLKLLVYPDDRIAYGSVLRSPFIRLSDDGFTLCMIKGRNRKIFDPALDKELAPEDRKRYQEAGKLYQQLSVDSRDLSVSSLLNKLWYDYGYRYEALWSLPSQVYLDLYDLFFQLARTIEERGKGMIEFLDLLEDVITKKEKNDDAMLSDDEEKGVQLLTIHRAKGLEFPVVFMYGCGQTEKTNLDHNLANFSESRGMYLKLPQSEQLPFGGDYFHCAEQELHKEKTAAELKRLLYVAMTRAECALFVTGILPKQTEKEKKILHPDHFAYDDFIQERLTQYKYKEDIETINFLRLLPDLDADSPLYSVKAIGKELPGMPQDYNDVSLDVSMEETALKAYPEYKNTAISPPYRYTPATINASSLHERRIQDGEAGTQQQSQSNDLSCDDVDVLLGKANLKNEEFGTIVHSFIEQGFANFSEKNRKIPPGIRAKINQNHLEEISEKASEMTNRFFASDLGRLSMASPFRETEFPILTAVDGSLVSGKIDLLFENENTIHIVDFKTDKVEDKGRHTGQLALYRRAISDIYEKPVRCSLFFTRSGNAVELNDQDFTASPEELVKKWKEDSERTFPP